MGSQSESIEQLLAHLNNIKRDHKVEFEEYLGALFGNIFNNDDGLQSLASERILHQIDQVMNQNGVWQIYPQEKKRLDNHKSMIQDVHTKLFYVLDLRVAIETLIDDHFMVWPTSETPLEISFQPEIMDQLQKIREEITSTPSDILFKFFNLYFAQILKKGINVEEIKSIVESACNENKRIEDNADCLALFVENCTGVVSGVGVKPISGHGLVKSLTNVKENMNQAAQIAITWSLEILGLSNKFDVNWIINYPNVYDGPSIALPLAIAIFRHFEPNEIRIDHYTGFTGEIDFRTSNLKKVGNIPEKLQGAVDYGLRRVFLPKANEEEAIDLNFNGLEIIPMESLSEARIRLKVLSSPIKMNRVGSSFEVRIREFEIKCRDRNFTVASGKSIQYGKQLIVNDLRNEVPVNIYNGSKGLRCIVGGKKDSSLYNEVNQLCIETFGQANSNSEEHGQISYKWLIKDFALRSTVKSQLQSFLGWKDEAEQNCEYRMSIQRNGPPVIVRQFINGSLTISGVSQNQLLQDVCNLIKLTLGAPPLSSQPEVPHSLAKKVDHEINVDISKRPIPSHVTSWIGTDESGKGDYFGPLVSAGVCVNRRTAAELSAIGVKDSKKLSDKRIRELAKSVRAICRGSYAEVPIPPQTYNSLYDQFKKEGKSLNTLLAWGHARAIENILAKNSCEYALADQFADERFILSKLQEAGRKIKLVQMPKAEQDIAVAAASILARDLFLFYLEKMNHEYHMIFPKGASSMVINAAKEFLRKYGKAELTKVAKVHFRTTKEL